ncbi:CRISPR-associated endonuclease Cas2 [Saccharolobus solfataricus]|jgi:CRISPR-associated protein Cas2|uniref:CRISPR-associated endoribonuclease Cas2 n=1 Tax=Acidianus brierleyi TaxID=41673 RepID=A0A2U9IH68_9CREN|nr:CRISPR-associated endonuclease Cas2 [Acidianus brierleyi]AWR95398.1 CRISPR-associated endonuclease Cas2 [Acidianus brierleyi]
MYVILVYDFDEKRVVKALNICRKYLTWIQRSVFEGELTEGNLYLLKNELKKIMKENDSVIIFKLEGKFMVNKEIMGKKISDNNIL